jgi:DNA-binding response OmpR family regulator
MGSGPASAQATMQSDSDDPQPPSGERYQSPNVVLLPSDLLVLVDDVLIELTRTQFLIFSYFLQNAGRWITTHELIEHVLGTHHQPDTSLVRVHVHAIRRRLGRRASWLESDPRRVRGYRWRGCGIEQSGGTRRQGGRPRMQSEI